MYKTIYLYAGDPSSDMADLEWLGSHKVTTKRLSKHIFKIGFLLCSCPMTGKNSGKITRLTHSVFNGS